MDEFRETLLAQGAALVGYADLSVLPADRRDNLPRAVSIALALNPRIIAKIAAGPTQEYAAEYARANDLLWSLAQSAADLLRARGAKATPLPATISDIDRTTLAWRFQHKTAATRAGLGWVGKCALLITEQFGSAVRLASVLTDAELPPGRPVERSRCGDCTACVDACAGHAPSGRHWQVGLVRQEFFDAFACCRTAIDLAGRQGISPTICGICIAVCPWTKAYLSRSGVR